MSHQLLEGERIAATIQQILTGKGMTELVDNGKNGFLYDYTEYEFLAGRIVELLKDLVVLAV